MDSLYGGNTYLTNINPLFILQKRAVRTMTFCKFDEHSYPLFKQTNILKLFDLIKFQISIFMYKFHKNRLPAVFDSYFLSISKVHNYSTRLSSTHAYSLPKHELIMANSELNSLELKCGIHLTQT